jgi:hypothetical protein
VIVNAAMQVIVFLQILARASEEEREVIAKSIVAVEDMELVMLIIRAFAMLVISIIQHLKNVSSLVMDNLVANVMGQIFCLVQAVLEELAIMVFVIAGQVLKASTVRQKR